MPKSKEEASSPLLGWVVYFGMMIMLSCVELGLVAHALEEGNWILPIIGSVGGIVGLRGWQNLTDENFDI